MATPEAWSQPDLNSRNCLTLQEILCAFSAPLPEHHAWAIIYKAIQCLEKILKATGSNTPKYLTVSCKDIVIHKDGFVHSDTFLSPSHNRTRLTSELKALEELGMVVYEALDYTVPEESQRKLATDLEVMLETMTDIDSEDEGDEGIEDCEMSGEAMKGILKMCRRHLEVESEAEEHYSSLCRALVLEAIEISSFMATVRRNEASYDEELLQLDRQEWSSIWQQLMHQLRTGIKLKKVNYSKTPSEFGLTPYEVLMDDIRTKKYKLNPVQIPPNVQKDARDEILDFIRSRPPLKSASLRVLKPRPSSSTPAEKLFEDIRRGETRKSLRKSVLNENEKREKLKLRSDSVNERKVIDLDDTIVNDLLNFEIDDCDSPDCKVELIDLTDTPDKSATTQKSVSKQATGNAFSKSISDGNLLRPVNKHTTASPLWNPGQQCAPLTLEEFCHIQIQMDKASLAGIDAETSREDLARGKVCFRCKISRFGLFTWSTECFACGRFVCSKCLTSVVIPINDTRDIPLVAFIPSKESLSYTSPCRGPTMDRLCEGCESPLSLPGTIRSPTSPLSTTRSPTTSLTPEAGMPGTTQSPYTPANGMSGTAQSPYTLSNGMSGTARSPYTPANCMPGTAQSPYTPANGMSGTAVSPWTPYTPAGNLSGATSPVQQYQVGSLPKSNKVSSPRLGRPRISPVKYKVSPGKCKVSPQTYSVPSLVPPSFKRSRTMSKAEGSTRKAKIRLALNSGVKQHVCKNCLDTMTQMIQNHHFSSPKETPLAQGFDLCSKCDSFQENLI